MGETESKMRNVFAAGVPFLSSSVGRTHIGGELSHATTMTTVERSDRSEGHFYYRRTPVNVDMEDGGGGPDASVPVVSVATEDLRAVDRYGTPVRTRAERCRSKHRPGADVEAVRPVRRRRGGIGEARSCAESV
jgi:hypothetical protein